MERKSIKFLLVLAMSSAAWGQSPPQVQAIMDRLAKLAPDNPEWKVDVAWFDEKIATLTK